MNELELNFRKDLDELLKKHNAYLVLEREQGDYDSWADLDVNIKTKDLPSGEHIFTLIQNDTNRFETYKPKDY